jgi:hypothetical protein
MVLDLIGFLAADLDAFLLDPTYEALLDEREKLLAEKLGSLLEFRKGGQTDELGPARRVRQLLEDLGAG